MIDVNPWLKLGMAGFVVGLACGMVWIFQEMGRHRHKGAWLIVALLVSMLSGALCIGSQVTVASRFSAGDANASGDYLRE